MITWKALSFSQPWLDFVMRAARYEADPKLVENRRWNTMHRGPFLLHAAKSFDAGAGAWAKQHGLQFSYPSREVLPRSCIVGVARLDFVLPRRSPVAPDLFADLDLRWWMRDQFGFLLSDVRELKPYACPGKLNFWPVSPIVVDALGLPPTPEEWT